MAAAGAHASSALEADLTLRQVAAPGATSKASVVWACVLSSLRRLASSLVARAKSDNVGSFLSRPTSSAACRMFTTPEAKMSETGLPMIPDSSAVATGADPSGGGGDVDMLSQEHMDRQTSGTADPTPVVLEAAGGNHSWQIEDAVTNDDSASSAGTVLTLRDYNWLEHPDKDISTWLAEQVDRTACSQTKSLRRRRRCLTFPSWTSLARTTLGGVLPAVSLKLKIPR